MLDDLDTMIPPVRTDPVWGRARSGPVPPEGQNGPGPRLAVLDWTGLVWTSPNRIIFINFKVDRKLKKWDCNPCNPNPVVSGEWWVVRGEMCMVTCEWQDESICWLGISVTPSVFGLIVPDSTGPKQSRPVQSRSRKIGDWSDPGPNISWTGPGLDCTVPVRTDPLLDWWNHCLDKTTDQSWNVLESWIHWTVG